MQINQRNSKKTSSEKNLAKKTLEKNRKLRSEICLSGYGPEQCGLTSLRKIRWQTLPEYLALH
jgi:hypothetical protein